MPGQKAYYVESIRLTNNDRVALGETAHKLEDGTKCLWERVIPQPGVMSFLCDCQELMRTYTMDRIQSWDSRESEVELQTVRGPGLVLPTAEDVQAVKEVRSRATAR